MKKMRWIALLGVAAVALIALAWAIRPALAKTQQQNTETASAAIALTGAAVEQSLPITGTTPADDATTASVVAIVKPGGADLYDTPNGAVLHGLDASTMLTATSRTEDGRWYQVESGELAGWVESAKVIALRADSLPSVAVDEPLPAAEGGQIAATAPVRVSTAPTSPISVTNAASTAAEEEDAGRNAESVVAGGGTAGSASAEIEVADAQTIAAATTGLPAVPAIVRGGGATLVSAPGESAGLSLRAGAVLNLTSISEDGTWLAVETIGTPVARGWVATEQVIYTSVASLPTGSGSAGSVAIGEGRSMSLVSTIASATESSAQADDSEASATESTTSAQATALSSDALDTVLVASGANRLNVRQAPGTANAIVGKAEPGAVLGLLGKTADGSWLQVLLDDGTTGWVAGAYVTGDTSGAPVMEEAISNADDVTSTAVGSVAEPSAAVQSADTVSAGAVSDSTSATGLMGTIVYQTSPGGTFYAYNLETGDQWPLTGGWDPAISPDGQTVAFVRGGGENGLYLIDIDGSNERLIYGERRDLSSPKWSPDGTYIVFGRGDSYITCRQIGRECLPDEVWLDRNPNMELDQFPLVDEYLQNLARVDMDGNNYRDIATLESAREPDWSNAGIVYTSSDGLQITDDSEDAVNRVVYFEPLQARDQDPDWAGERIVFVTRQSSHYQIFSVNPDGSDKRSLTKPVTTLVDQIPSNVAPAFSPDGTQIVFLSNRSENNEAGEWHLWVMNADGSGQRMLETIVPIVYGFNHMEQAVSWGA